MGIKMSLNHFVKIFKDFTCVEPQISLWIRENGVDSVYSFGENNASVLGLMTNFKVKQSNVFVIE